VIKIAHLTKTFESKEGGFTALDDISLTIKDGEIFGLIGKSGAGKTTLLRLLSGLEKPSEGRIEIDGEPAGFRALGIVFQGYNLLMQQDVFDNVAIPFKIAKKKKDEYKKSVDELLSLVGIAEKAHEYPAKLSGGQKQRVAIARALACDSNILLLDEPTSALDSSTTSSVLALLKKINIKRKTTIVIITHELEVVRKICSKAALLDNSRLIAQGDAEYVLAVLEKRGY
jgi:D-methionine transport system ATP-binding protein